MIDANRCLSIAAKCKTVKQIARLKRVVELDMAGSNGTKSNIDRRIGVSNILFGYMVCMIDNRVGLK